jgi:hypothetical protein
VRARDGAERMRVGRGDLRELPGGAGVR